MSPGMFQDMLRSEGICKIDYRKTISRAQEKEFLRVFGILASVHQIRKAETWPEQETHQPSHQVGLGRRFILNVCGYRLTAAWASNQSWVRSENASSDD